MLPQAPTSDTTGWFARDAATFAKTSAAMLGEDIPPPGDASLPAKLVVAVDAFGFADAASRLIESHSGQKRRTGPQKPLLGAGALNRYTSPR